MVYAAKKQHEHLGLGDATELFDHLLPVCDAFSVSNLRALILYRIIFSQFDDSLRGFELFVDIVFFVDILMNFFKVSTIRDTIKGNAIKYIQYVFYA